MSEADPTQPNQMLSLPDWYAGGYVDIEDMVCNYLQLLAPNVYVCTWMPPGHYDLSPGDPVGGTQPTLRVWRQPGKADPDLRRDEAVVQVAAITPTRKESWELSGFVRRMMDDDVIVGAPIPLTGGGKASIATASEWLGPQLIPERIVDEKFIPVSFKLGCREPGGLPNYRKTIHSLLLQED